LRIDGNAKRIVLEEPRENAKNERDRTKLFLVVLSHGSYYINLNGSKFSLYRKYLIYQAE